MERAALKTLAAERLPTVLSESGLRVQAWPVDRDGWRREILRTTVEA